MIEPHTWKGRWFVVGEDQVRAVPSRAHATSNTLPYAISSFGSGRVPIFNSTSPVSQCASHHITNEWCGEKLRLLIRWLSTYRTLFTIDTPPSRKWSGRLGRIVWSAPVIHLLACLSSCKGKVRHAFTLIFRHWLTTIVLEIASKHPYHRELLVVLLQALWHSYSKTLHLLPTRLLVKS